MQTSKSVSFRIKMFFTFALILVFFISTSYVFAGAKVKNYSAESYEISPDGKETVIGNLYWTPDAKRMDGMPGMSAPGAPEMDISVLVLEKKDKQYMYNHTKKLVFESPIDEESFKSLSKELKDIQTEKVLGKEKVEGYRCVKKEIVTTINIMGMGQKSKMIVWQSDKFDFPLKQIDEEGAVSGMRNIKTGKPPAKVFKPLKGYTKVDNVIALMGLDFGAMMAEEDSPEQNHTATNRETPAKKEQLPDLERLSEGAGKMIKGLFDQFK